MISLLMLFTFATTSHLIETWFRARFNHIFLSFIPINNTMEGEFYTIFKTQMLTNEQLDN